jgi:hypothetical protein
MQRTLRPPSFPTPNSTMNRASLPPYFRKLSVLTDQGRVMVKSYLLNNLSFPFQSVLNQVLSLVHGR